MLRKICSAPGCSRLTEGTSKYCGLHQYLEERDQRRRQERTEQFFASIIPSQWPELYNSTRWKQLRQQQLKQNPACQKCGTAEATEVHHVKPHRGDPTLFFDPNNLVSLCHDCHSEETRSEVQQRIRERNQEKQRNQRIRKLWY